MASTTEREFVNPDADAQYNLAWMYDNGKGVTQDYKEAVKWFQLAAINGDDHAKQKLANFASP